MSIALGHADHGCLQTCLLLCLSSAASSSHFLRLANTMSYYVIYLSSNFSLNNFTYTYNLKNLSRASSPPLFLLLLPLLKVAFFFQNNFVSMIDKGALNAKHEVFIDPLFHRFPTLMAKHILDKVTHTDQIILWQKLPFFVLQFETCCTYTYFIHCSPFVFLVFSVQVNCESFPR